MSLPPCWSKEARRKSRRASVRPKCPVRNKIPATPPSVLEMNWTLHALAAASAVERAASPTSRPLNRTLLARCRRPIGARSIDHRPLHRTAGASAAKRRSRRLRRMPPMAFSLAAHRSRRPSAHGLQVYRRDHAGNGVVVFAPQRRLRRVVGSSHADLQLPIDRVDRQRVREVYPARPPLATASSCLRPMAPTASGCGIRPRRPRAVAHRSRRPSALNGSLSARPPLATASSCLRRSADCVGLGGISHADLQLPIDRVDHQHGRQARAARPPLAMASSCWRRSRRLRRVVRIQPRRPLVAHRSRRPSARARSLSARPPLATASSCLRR